MVKKKNTEQEPKKQSETTDNEMNNSINEDADQTGSTVPPAEDSAERAEEPAEGEGKASDKVVKEELSPEEKLAVMHDRYLRLSAEFDNYRKRSLREKIELSKYASEDVLLKLLPVMDDFELALANMETATDCSAIKSGIDLIYSKLTDFLKLNEVKEIESLNCGFNVDLHDAVAKTSVEDEKKKGLIVDVVKKGYYLKDKVIRHAKVVIGE
jgi:molecular chaperone GrpE